MINKKILILISLLLFLPLFVGCFGVPPTNQAPTITSTPITTATVDEAYTYNVDATDPDGDTLTYSLTTYPSGMTINSATGVINWIPSVEGDYDIIVEVSDGEKSTTQSFTITVSEEPIIPPYSPPIIDPPVNHAPVITSTQITTVTVDEPYTYDVNATDSDGDTLTYSLTTNPAGMTIDPLTGVISWTPASGQIGDNNVTVEVSDGNKSATQSFIITVYNILTGITVLPAIMDLYVGETDTITSITASYTYGPDQGIDPADCVYTFLVGVVDMPGPGEITGVAVGSVTIDIEYTEGAITMSDTVDVTVYPNELTSITVLPEDMALFVTEDDTITSIMASYNYGDDVSIDLDDCTYGSSDETKATVAVGVVTGVAAGLATITVSYLEGGITMTDTVTVTVNTTPNLELTPTTQSVILNNHITINVEVEDVIDLLGGLITLNFDATKLEYVSSAIGSFFTSGVVDIDSQGTGYVALGFGTLSGVASGPGTIITVVFNTLAVDAGTNITFGTTVLSHSATEDIIHTHGSGCSVTITGT